MYLPFHLYLPLQPSVLFLQYKDTGTVAIYMFFPTTIRLYNYKHVLVEFTCHTDKPKLFAY